MSDLLSLDDARSRVAKGAALLDQEWPGWAREIKVDRLDMGSLCGCVLGQLMGDFGHYHRLIGADETSSYGFDLDPPNNYPDEVKETNFWTLGDVWREAISERLAQSSSEAIPSEVTA